MDFDLLRYFADRRKAVDTALDRWLPAADRDPINLNKAIRYSVFCGGKRLRPILVIAGAEVAGGTIDAVLPLACAVECIHTFSLIHDDLPAVDDDDLRRGQPTNHVVFGEATAILAGDALLAMAFEFISYCRTWASADAVLDVISLISRASGTQGMVGGQVADIAAERRADLSISDVESIHVRKTGALLCASLLGGARLANATPAVTSALSEYGRQIGIAFQITDDVLDIQGDSKKIGKPVGSDLKNDKATYPKLIGVDASHALAEKAADAAIACLHDLGPAAEPLRRLAKYMVERDS
jgi:geranylgeranyl diphosphate synthase type II